MRSNIKDKEFISFSRLNDFVSEIIFRLGEKKIEQEILLF